VDLSLESFKDLPVWQAALIGLGGVLMCLAGYRFLVTFSHLYAAGLFGLGGLLLGGAIGIPWLTIGLGVFFGAIGFVLGRAYLWVNTAATGILGGAALGIWAGQLAGWGKSVWPSAIGAGVGGGLTMVFQRHVLILATSILGAVAAGIGTMVCLNSVGVLPVEQYSWAYLGLIAALVVAGVSAQLRGSEEMADQFRRLQDARRHRVDRV
jgi:hypothetical protein